MFWRKKQSDADIFSLDSNDQRASFRVCPLSTQPIRIEVQGKSIFLKDISASGLSFCNNNFRAGDSLPITFDLPGENVTVSGRIEIIAIDGRGVCRCRFVGLNNDSINAIHRYVLAVQKQVIRMRRDSFRKVSQSEDTAAQEKALEELLEGNLQDAVGLSIPKSFTPD